MAADSPISMRWLGTLTIKNPVNGPMDSSGIQALRQLMVTNHDTFKPIWITEYGWSLDPSDPNHIDPATQQSDHQTALNFFATASNNYITIATYQILADIYSLNSAGIPVATIMGLCDQALSQRPAYSTFAGFSKPTT